MENLVFLGLKFLHISFVIVWLGGSFLLVVRAAMADRRDDAIELRYLNDEITELSRKVIAPIALGALVTGVALVWISPWSFPDLWIAIGLVCFASTFAIGVGIILPRSNKIRFLTERHGDNHPMVVAERQRLRLIGRFDVFVLFVIVYDMVLKPSAQDVMILLVMAIAVAISAIYLATGMRAIKQSSVE